MCKWNYIRYCPYCKQDKPYRSRYSKNNKTRCNDCYQTYLDKKINQNFKCDYCKNRYNKFVTNNLKELLNHFIICGGLTE